METRMTDLQPAEMVDAGRRLSRRKLLGSAAVIAGGAAAAPLWLHLDELVASVAAADFGDTPRHHWAMVFDLRRCDGCGDCTRACQKTHYLEPEQTWIKVYTLSSDGGGQFFMPRLCMQCADAPCLNVCPVKATFKNEDGVVLVDQDKCIGCRLCMSACPYEARYFNWSEPTVMPPEGTIPTPEFPSPQRRGTVGKCTFCVHHTERGELPSCVSACNMEAIWIGDLDADVATNGAETIRLSTYLAENHAVRYKDELNTGPHVYYVLGHGQDLDY
jgi:molybdopterin-containing oxidoreductase family iron-sulfur binding subunit